MNHHAQDEHSQQDYTTWPPSSLIVRITELERKLQSQNSQYQSPLATSSTPNSPKPSSSTLPTKTKPPPRPFNPSKYSTRPIALKLAYLGQNYNGYEHANGNITPLPTIEEVLWKALMKGRLIFPAEGSYTSHGSLDSDGERGESRERREKVEISWERCGYSKCGRTDRGVSAFGQVVGLRVRSKRPLPKQKPQSKGVTNGAGNLDSGEGRERVSRQDQDGGFNGGLPDFSATELQEDDIEPAFDDIKDELHYTQTLNTILPPDIRVLAWCPHPPPNFDARFSCRERRYRYFFTQPAFSPTPGPMGFHQGSGAKTEHREGWFDIKAMREGAKRFVGLHDFRNFCRVDTSKQMTNFERRVFHAGIEMMDPKQGPLGYVARPDFRQKEAPDGSFEAANGAPSEQNPSTPQVYYFEVHGSAFLWHQIRHMVAILFLIGQGLESPSVVSELLDVKSNPRRPAYEIASDAPLVLWDCVFPAEGSDSREDALEWIYPGDSRGLEGRSGKTDDKFGLGGLVDELWKVWRRRKIDEVLAGTLLDLVAAQGDSRAIAESGFKGPDTMLLRSQKIFEGGDEARMGGKYLPVMQKRRMETVDELNAKYLAGKGARRSTRQNGEGNENRNDEE